MTIRKLAVLILLASLAGTGAHAQTILSGQSDGGAYFTIVVPDAWNGDLVIWNHGFSLGPIEPVELEDLGPFGDDHG